MMSPTGLGNINRNSDEVVVKSAVIPDRAGTMNEHIDDEAAN